VLWARYDVLASMPPWQTGGGMILSVKFDHTEFQDTPHRFEAGTPDIAGAVGLGLALDFIESIGREAILEHEEALTGYGVDRLSRIPGVQLVGGGQRRLSILSFNVGGVHPHDVGTVLDRHNVAVRVGHHCAQPLMEKLDLAGTVRASLGVYNDEADIDRLAEAVEACREMFRR
jgi:cysteine desulfurase/selenocysteine lyase